MSRECRRRGGSIRGSRATLETDSRASKIPHTALIAIGRNQSGSSRARVVCQQFLSPQPVSVWLVVRAGLLHRTSRFFDRFPRAPGVQKHIWILIISNLCDLHFTSGLMNLVFSRRTRSKEPEGEGARIVEDSLISRSDERSIVIVASKGSQFAPRLCDT